MAKLAPSAGAACSLAWPPRASGAAAAAAHVAVGTVSGTIALYALQLPAAGGSIAGQAVPLVMLGALDGPPADCICFLPPSFAQSPLALNLMTPGAALAAAATAAAAAANGTCVKEDAATPPWMWVAASRGASVVLYHGAVRKLEWQAHDHNITAIEAPSALATSGGDGGGVSTVTLFTSSADGLCRRWMVSLGPAPVQAPAPSPGASPSAL
ncbi:unnamed protein product, partial [Phaeothamnion confervicola]